MVEDGSFLENPLHVLHHSNEPQTVFSTTLDMNYYMEKHYPCGLKVAWKEHQPTLYSYLFPKNSPLHPFFNYHLKIYRESGVLFKLERKWNILDQKSKCGKGAGDVTKISFSKVVLLFLLLAIGMLIAIVIWLLERVGVQWIVKSRTSVGPGSDLDTAAYRPDNESGIRVSVG